MATALGDSSSNLWLKLPYCDNFGLVAEATTCPIVFLGGESKGNTTHFLETLKDGLNSAPNIRGTMLGRNVMYPENNNPEFVAQHIQTLVHQKATTREPALV